MLDPFSKVRERYIEGEKDREGLINTSAEIEKK
jgi:hypothetical protein